MKQRIELGAVPAAEDCQQTGTANYDPVVARAECRAFIGQLKRMFGEPPEGAHLRITSNPHDFGNYMEVAVEYEETGDTAAYDDGNQSPSASEVYAFMLEEKMPEHWDDIARDELAAR